MAVLTQLVIYVLTVLISMSMMVTYEFVVGYFIYKKRGLEVPWYYKKFKNSKYRSVSAFTPHYFFAWTIVGTVNYLLMRLLQLISVNFVLDTVVSIATITAVMISLEFSIGFFYFRKRGQEVPWVYVKYADHKFRSISGVDFSYLTGWLVLGIIHHFVFEGFNVITSYFL